jgi:hypothetical protein
VQETKEGDISLTCEKSTKFPNFELEIPFVCPRSVGIKETKIADDEKEIFLEASRREEERDICDAGGTKGEEQVVNVASESSRPPPVFELVLRKASGLPDRLIDPTQLGDLEMGLGVSNPPVVGPI